MFPHNNEGRNRILKEYELEQLQSIVDHGYQHSVCGQHLHYVDSIPFFDTYEGEILDLIHTRHGLDELVSIFKRSEADFDMYKNECCWLFIENVAEDVIQSLEYEQQCEDEMIEDYMTQSISNNGYTLDELNKSAKDLMNLSVYNPPGSMNLKRYSHS